MKIIKASYKNAVTVYKTAPRRYSVINRGPVPKEIVATFSTYRQARAYAQAFANREAVYHIPGDPWVLWYRV